MNTLLRGVCPLCGKAFLRVELFAHILAEQPAVRHGTMAEIMNRYPSWRYVRGACENCWETHREQSRISVGDPLVSGITPAETLGRPPHYLGSKQLINSSRQC